MTLRWDVGDKSPSHGTERELEKSFFFLLLHFGACFPVLDLSPHALQALLSNIMPDTLTSNSIVRNFNKKWNKTSGAGVRVMTGRDKIEWRRVKKVQVLMKVFEVTQGWQLRNFDEKCETAIKVWTKRFCVLKLGFSRKPNLKKILKIYFCCFFFKNYVTTNLACLSRWIIALIPSNCFYSPLSLKNRFREQFIALESSINSC